MAVILRVASVTSIPSARKGSVSPASPAFNFVMASSTLVLNSEEISSPNIVNDSEISITLLLAKPKAFVIEANTA